jgi:hypothetical protein
VDMMKTNWMKASCIGVFLVGCLLAAAASTILGPSQISGVPQLPGEFGFNCVSVANSSTFCNVDQSLVLNLGLPCPAGNLPCPVGTPGVAPVPGACPSTGSVIATSEPAVYFCVQTMPGGPALNWIRVAAVSTW